MVARYTLITPSPKVVEILLVKGADDVRYVVAVVVYCLHNLLWLLDGGNCELRRRNDKTLIDENVRPHWMVHCHQRQLIVVIGLPKLSRDAQIVITIAWHELVVADLVPLFSGFDSGRADRVNAQTNRRTPGHGVFDKLHLLAVVSKEKWTRALQALLGKD